MKVSLREFFDERFRSLRRALKLQAKEYGRRLDELNHAHEQNVRRNAEFVGIEKFEGAIRELKAQIEGQKQEFSTYKETTNRALVLREGRGGGLNSAWIYLIGGAALLGSFATFMSAVIAIVVWFLKH